MILLALWFSSTALVVVSAAHWLPIAIQIAVLPLICTAILICGTQLYEDPCFRVPFWATPTRLRSLSEIEDPPPGPTCPRAREAVATTFVFWSITLWSVHYTVAAISCSVLASLSVLSVIGNSISCSSSSSSSSPMTNGSSSSTDA